jgi:hypothetical protein
VNEYGKYACIRGAHEALVMARMYGAGNESDWHTPVEAAMDRCAELLVEFEDQYPTLRTATSEDLGA